MDIRLIEAALDRQSAAITRMAQRQPHTTYNHGPLWDMVDAAKKELRDAQQPGDPETSSKNDQSVSIEFDGIEFQVGHYMQFPAKVLEKLREAGIPAVGDWMLRGVEYGQLTVTYDQPEIDYSKPVETRQKATVTFEWRSLGRSGRSIEVEVDLADELI